MAQDITDNHEKSFCGHWTYAHSLNGVKKWLGNLAQDDDESNKEFIVGVIEDMVCLKLVLGNLRTNFKSSFARTGESGRKPKTF